jgi:hemerythrin-like domain-containing protein
MDKLTELRDSVEHHVEEEENEMFPKAEKVLGESRLQEMGRQMEQMKQGKSATATNRRK